MPFRTRGLHHVTAIATRPQANAEFYVRTLGLRLVKRTVNLDDPQTYHLYYGDRSGTPGTLLSFFAWPGAGAGMRGAGEATAVALAVPPGSLPFWEQRLGQSGVPLEHRSRFGERVLVFPDPDGVPLELVERPRRAVGEPWDKGPIAADHAIQALDAVTLRVNELAPTRDFLQQTLGLELIADEQEGGRTRGRLRAAEGDLGSFVDLSVYPDALPGRLGSGSVHHIAFRADDEAGIALAREGALAAGAPIAKLQDRVYFHTTFFHEPGGTLLEVATDGPGFTVDEPVDELGLSLKLPSWLEEDRLFLRGRLPVVASPEYADRWDPS